MKQKRLYNTLGNINITKPFGFSALLTHIGEENAMKILTGSEHRQHTSEKEFAIKSS